MPLLTSILRESSATPGLFTVVGGEDVGEQVALPTLESCQNITSSTLSWRSQLFVDSCLQARLSLESLAATLSSSSPPTLAATLSGSRHLLLVASAITPFLFSGNTISVTLGGVPCAINWMLPSIASITTPSLAALCKNSLSAALGDCGLAPLILSYQNTSSYLPLPAVYPPLFPATDWPAQLATLDESPSTPLAQGASLVGLPLSQLLASSIALTTVGTGIRIIDKCTDPLFATPELCTVINGSQPLVNGTGLLCVWGTGDDCLPCPSGALCPGGTQLLPLPGFWCPLPTSPPDELNPCPSPDSTLRCPGYALISSVGGVYGCGKGYRGQLCTACDSGYFRLRGGCKQCPAISFISFITPLLVFLAGLLSFGLAMVVIVYFSLKRSKRGTASLYEAIPPVANLIIWSWISAQGVASLFTQSQRLAPAELGPIFSAVSALQFQGIALDPACYTLIPFFSFYVSFAVVLFSYTVGALALWGVGSQRACLKWLSTQFLSLISLALSLGYGALTSEFSSALVCTLTAPMSVVDYLQTSNDGSALLARFPHFSSADISNLVVASTNPLLAAKSGLAPILQAVIPVSVLANDPYKVCGEASHKIVRPLAIFMCAVFTLAFPLLHLWTLWKTGSFKGLRRMKVVQRFISGQDDGVSPSNPPSRPICTAINETLKDSSLLSRGAWFSSFQKLQLAIITGLIAVSNARLTLFQYIFSQAVILVVCLLACVIVSRARFLKPMESWKRPVILLLNAVTGTTAVLNTLLQVLSENNLGPRNRTAISSIPIFLAAVISITLLCSWWLNLRLYTILPPGPPPELSREDTHLKPKNASEIPPGVVSSRSPLWDSFTDDDGDSFWYSSELGISAWNLPPGAITSCGWRYEGGVWKNTLSGAISDTPPPPYRESDFFSTLQDSPPIIEPPPQSENLWVLTHDDDHSSPTDGAFWHNPSTGESVWTLPGGAETSCGWKGDIVSGIWRHWSSGAVRLSPPSTDAASTRIVIKSASRRSREYERGHAAVDEWVSVFSDDDFVWLQPSTGCTVSELPSHAYTSCGWWYHEGMHTWIHKGSGAFLKTPPSPNPDTALDCIKAHLGAVEAREWALDPRPWLVSTQVEGIDSSSQSDLSPSLEKP